jgi:hypothetical protein
MVYLYGRLLIMLKNLFRNILNHMWLFLLDLFMCIYRYCDGTASRSDCAVTHSGIASNNQLEHVSMKALWLVRCGVPEFERRYRGKMRHFTIVGVSTPVRTEQKSQLSSFEPVFSVNRHNGLMTKNVCVCQILL